MESSGGIFHYDNKFSRILEKITDSILVSVFWLIFCIPLITAGTSTAAFYHTIRKCLRHDEGYVWRTFWNFFKGNFKQGTKLWLFVGALFLLFYYEKELVYENFLTKGSAVGLLYYFFLFAIIFIMIWTLYIFTYLARFEDSGKIILKNTFLIAIGNLLWTFLILLLFSIAAIVIYIFPVSIAVLSVPLFLLYDVILDRIYKKYRKVGESS